MIKTLNLTDRIQKQLPSELVGFLQLAVQTAAGLKQNLYLVALSDLLLKRIIWTSTWWLKEMPLAWLKNCQVDTARRRP
jgi:hypothetical protein